MKTKPRTVDNQDLVVENIAAELTEAAYPVVLRYGIVGSSIDLKLHLWRVFVDTVKEWRTNAVCPDETQVTGARLPRLVIR